MKLTIKSANEKYLSDNDYQDFLTIEIDGKKEFHVYEGAPEDATLYRDFADCNLVPELMRKAYEAGKNGEDFTIEKIKSDNIS